MISASKYHDFSYGHRVVGHEGKCKNLHGHNGRVHFTCSAGEELDDVGRVIDFSVIGAKLCNWVEEHWDHKMLISEFDPLANGLVRLDPTIVWVDFNPTAENMALFLLQVVGPKQLKGTGVTLLSVTLEETRKCRVEVTIPMNSRQTQLFVERDRASYVRNK